MEKKVKKTIQELFDLLSISGDFSVSITDDVIDVILDTPDSGMVIGYHGDMLESLQLILSLCLAKKMGEYKRVSLEVGEYKKNREDYLQNLAFSTKERVVNEGQEIALPELKSWERRVIHLILQNDNDVVSESVGEGKNRTLVIRPK